MPASNFATTPTRDPEYRVPAGCPFSPVFASSATIPTGAPPLT